MIDKYLSSTLPCQIKHRSNKKMAKILHRKDLHQSFKTFTMTTEFDLTVLTTTTFA
jgi:hypothetical protein